MLGPLVWGFVSSDGVASETASFSTRRATLACISAWRLSNWDHSKTHPLQMGSVPYDSFTWASTGCALRSRKADPVCERRERRPIEVMTFR